MSGGGGMGGVGGIGGIGGIGGMCGIGAVGGAGMTVNVGTIQGQPATGMEGNAPTHGQAPDVVVNISNTAVQALNFETGNVNIGAIPTSKLAEDLAALALLAILERDQQQNGALAMDLVAAATAVSAYMAVQSLGANG